MILQSLRVSNFRNYTDRFFTISPALTIIIGPNTAGKTSFLEALMVLSLGKSFRAGREEEMIKINQQVGRVTIVLGNLLSENKNDKDTIESVLTTGFVQGKSVPRKKFLINGISKRLSSIVGNLPTVLFWPEDLELIVGNPSGRRRYLDGVLLQSDALYRRAHSSYDKALRIRNKLLRLIKENIAIKKDEMDYWEEQLITHGSYIHQQRKNFLQSINRYKMSNDTVNFHAIYDHSIISRERLNSYAIPERSSGMTLVGPHRDDIILYKGLVRNENENLRKYGSRGEQRLGVLWMKLAELTYISKSIENQPLLLLDDILSELDSNHQRLVIDMIQRQQSIITTTDQALIPKKVLAKATIIQL